MELKYFLFTHFLLIIMLIEHLIDLRNVKSESLNFRIDLQDKVTGGWSELGQYHWMIDLSSRLLKILE